MYLPGQHTFYDRVPSLIFPVKLSDNFPSKIFTLMLIVIAFCFDYN